MKSIILAVSITLLSSSALAVQEARSGRLDDRIKHVEYQRGQVYKVDSHYYQSSLIMFSRDEKIIHLDAGDAAAWQINPINNYISIKPIMEKADSNLNVLTENKVTGEVRPYVFELVAERAKNVKDDSSTFMLEFTYPQDELREKMAKMAQQDSREASEVVKHRRISAEDWNMDYTYAGSSNLVPIRSFDDGDFTYFQFPENMDTPAIFLVDEKGNESLVNFHVSEKYIVVQRTGAQFILRDGDRATCIFNNSYSNGAEQTTMHKAEE